ncbi:glutaredoxin 3-like [Teleopsis dalmanni]|uniref:glutaredoxin 3-like n=2 Tax=Teleopsis dalmanni TaxID=139649 RepID=UPI0018CF8D6C|nr:glutaredoxin 3-like [Teleopsis dalmanni]XP_037939949.1 glutaredoxin 3-like [Teleopsis dalmanni]
MSVINIKTAEEYNNAINEDKVSVVLFSADWAEQCKQVSEVLEELAKILKQLQFYSLNAEKYAEISLKHQIDAVPTIIFFKAGTAVDRVDGVDIAALTTKCKKLGANNSSNSGETLEERLKSLINHAPVMIFMKGDRNAPRCGFSRTLIEIVNKVGIPYETFDILTDEEVRQGLKTYSDWPTYPQVYVKGELIGGLDIVKELQANNELESSLKG